MRVKLKFHRHKLGCEDIIADLHNEGFSDWIMSVGMYYGCQRIQAEDIHRWPDLKYVVLVESERTPVAYAHMRLYLDGDLRIGSFHGVGCCEYDQS